LVASGTAVVTALWMFLVYELPVHVVRSALGPTWPAARPVFLYIGLGVTIAAWSGAASAGLRALRAAKEQLWLAVVLAPCLVAPAMIGAVVDGLHGAAVGSLITNVIMASLSWIVLNYCAKKIDLRALDAEGSGEIDATDTLIDASLVT
jgi:hypothetical protein